MAARRTRSAAFAAARLPDRLGREPLPRVFVLAGSERWLRAGATEQVVRAALPEGDPGGALARIDARVDAEGAPGARALDELASASLFAPAKVVVVEHAEALAHAGKRGPAAILALVEAAAGVGAEAARLVLVTPRPVKGKGAVPAAKLAAAGAWVVDCRSLYDAPGPWERGAPPHDHELSRFVAGRVRSAYGKRMSLEVAHGLTRLVGTDLGALDGALRALALYAGDAPQVSAEDVEASIGATREDPLWRLADAVFEGRRPDALALVAAAFERGVHDARGAAVTRPEALAPMIVATLFTAWRRILAGTEGLARGETPEAVARAAGLPPFLASGFATRCRRSPDAVLALSEAFFEAERGLKGGGVPPRLATERLVLRLATPPAG